MELEDKIKKDLDILRMELKKQNKMGARWRLYKNLRYGKRTAIGRIDLDPYILKGTNLKGKKNQSIKGNSDFIYRIITIGS